MSTADCSWGSVAGPSPLVCPPSFLFFSSSIFFLNISMKLPSLANALAAPAVPGAPGPTGLVPGAPGLEPPSAGLDGEAGLLLLESLLLRWAL